MKYVYHRAHPSTSVTCFIFVFFGVWRVCVAWLVLSVYSWGVLVYVCTRNTAIRAKMKEKTRENKVGVCVCVFTLRSSVSIFNGRRVICVSVSFSLYLSVF